MLRLWLLTWLWLLPGWAAEWRLVYFYDHDRDVLRFTDLAFPSAQRGIAVGILGDETGRRKDRGLALVTSDGGASWAEVPLEDEPVSLFFLDNSTGWMVGRQGIWKTEESGRSWRRLSRHAPGALLRVWFLDARRGFAIGREKTVLETQDGGRTWKPVAAAQEPTGNPEYAVYTQIAFLNDRVGVIAGSAVPPRRGPASERQVPTMTLQLQTSDGGRTWKPSSAPLFGEIAGLRLREREGLILYVYRNQFEWPSEVYRLDLRTGATTTVHRDKTRRVTDMALFDGHAYLAAVEPPRRATEAARLPGKVHVLESRDFTVWTEIAVDYRATGTWPLLAGPDAQHLFLATDHGMILRLEP
jgi:hypothetical protein